MKLVAFDTRSGVAVSSHVFDATCGYVVLGSSDTDPTRSNFCAISDDVTHGISNKHAILTYMDGRWLICDLCSTNGVSIPGNSDPILSFTAITEGETENAGFVLGVLRCFVLPGASEEIEQTQIVDVEATTQKVVLSSISSHLPTSSEKLSSSRGGDFSGSEDDQLLLVPSQRREDYSQLSEKSSQMMHSQLEKEPSNLEEEQEQLRPLENPSPQVAPPTQGAIPSQDSLVRSPDLPEIVPTMEGEDTVTATDPPREEMEENQQSPTSTREDSPLPEAQSVSVTDSRDIIRGQKREGVPIPPRSSKRIKPRPVKLMITGLELPDEWKKFAKVLQFEWTSSLDEVTHLVVGDGSRTMKVMRCLMPDKRDVKIVKSEWFEQSYRAKAPVNADHYVPDFCVSAKSKRDSAAATNTPIFNRHFRIMGGNSDTHKSIEDILLGGGAKIAKRKTKDELVLWCDSKKKPPKKNYWRLKNFADHIFKPPE